jgi:hypothetical protein
VWNRRASLAYSLSSCPCVGRCFKESKRLLKKLRFSRRGDFLIDGMCLLSMPEARWSSSPESRRKSIIEASAKDTMPRKRMDGNSASAGKCPLSGIRFARGGRVVMGSRIRLEQSLPHFWLEIHHGYFGKA